MIKQRLVESARWFYWYPFRKLVQSLPAGWGYGLARLGAKLAPMAAGPQLMRLAQEVEALGLGESQAERLAVAEEALFLRFALELEVLYYPRLGPGNISRFTRIEGRERLEQALAQGRGVLLLFAHFGANQMIMPAMGYRGYQMCQMSAPPTVWTEIFGNELKSPMREKGREIRWQCEESLPVTHINIFGSLKKVFSHLKENHIIGLALDGGGGKDRWGFPFLGREIFLSPGAMRIALKAGCPVLPTFMVREKEGPSVMHIEQPLELERGLPEEDALRQGMASFVAILEDYTRRHPSHYLNFIAWRSVREEMGEPAFIAAREEA